MISGAGTLLHGHFVEWILSASSHLQDLQVWKLVFLWGHLLNSRTARLEVSSLTMLILMTEK